MPELCRFRGIVVAMFYDDHLPPHFHARHRHDRAIIDIETLQPLRGLLHPRAFRLLMPWARLHQADLMDNWRRAQRHEPLHPIPPLE